MLPTRLELHNFLAYRHPEPLPLEGLHLACLNGRNGAGKSSLLDAITWALWGKARTRSDDDLIHIGESEMSVTLDFVQDGNEYRVTRSRKFGRKRGGEGRSNVGQSSLTLLGREEGGASFKVLANGVREAQPHIEQLLRLNYDVFVNSAFLQQGKADTFTTKTATERKRILTEILGLDRWDQYEEEAKKRLRDIAQESFQISSRISEWEAQLAEEPALKLELEIARQQLAEMQAEVVQGEARLDEVRGADVELRSAEAALTTVQLNTKERENDLQSLESDIQHHSERLARFQQVVDEAPQIQEGYQKLELARAADLELGDKLRALSSINESLSDLQRQVQEARQLIELEIRELDTLLDQDEQVLDSAHNARNALASIAEQVATLEALEQQRNSRQESLARLKEEAAELRTANQSLHTEMNEIKERLEMLDAATEPKCPLCGQPLDDAQYAQLIEEMQTEGTQRGDTWRNNKNRLEALQEETTHLHQQIQEADKALKELPRLRSQEGSYSRQLEDAEAAENRQRSNSVKRDALQQRLDTEDFAQELRSQLAKIEAERNHLGYNSADHEEVRQTLSSYQLYQNRAHELEMAQQAIPQHQEYIRNARQRQERWQKNLQEYQVQAAKYQAEIEGLQKKLREMRQRQEELNRLRSQQRNAEEKVISVEQALSSINTLRERRLSMMERRAQLSADENIYEQLKTAFGRNGIPAMIIEAIIPELEDATNRLLSRMSNNQMHVRFDTQREKKTGGIIETLDILIADELGTRDYSLFSGGEAFRIDFAIRIALSQLLARRAGAQLRTLFIDEGFGTQDNIGRERLVEAITAIQDDFDLILVITHIEDLKDAFPAQIEVTKTADGSVAVVR